MNWITSLQLAIDYVEDHITEKLDYDVIAAQGFSSSYHFQRIFSLLCGMTLGEYIRNRRLSLAGADLAAGKMKVIDAAFKYGYESPDSFAKAFQKFHGILPSEARTDGSSLKSFSRMVIKISMEGGSLMDYRIAVKDEMILTEWMPDMGFRLAEAPELVVYHWMPQNERRIEIWMPVEKCETGYL